MRCIRAKARKPREWRKGQDETLAPRFGHGQVDAALTHLYALRKASDREPIDKLEEAITSVENQREWIGNYQQWQEAGYPEGLGLVERGVAVAINPRMKRRGMRRIRANANAVVALRVRLLNTAWDEASAKRRVAA